MHIPPRPTGGSECPRGENKTISAPPARTYLGRAHLQLGGRREGGLVRQTASARGARYTGVRSRPPRRAPTDEGQSTLARGGGVGGCRCGIIYASAQRRRRRQLGRDEAATTGSRGAGAEGRASTRDLAAYRARCQHRSMPLRLRLSGYCRLQWPH